MSGLPRDVHAQARDNDGFSIKISIPDIWPPIPVTDLTAYAGAEGQALLQWTSPVEDGNLAHPMLTPVSQYILRAATYSIADLGSDTTAWFNAANAMSPPPILGPGTLQSVLTSLSGGTTYYFALKSMDNAGLMSDIDAKAKAGNQAFVGVKGVAAVTDLTALPGANSGEIELVWTEPSRIGTLEPSRYELRVSSTGQIATDAEFLAAQLLSVFSPTPLPGMGAPASTRSYTITGLIPGATYYLASRVLDAGAPAMKGRWARSVLANLNPFNFSHARFDPRRPEPVTNLTALPSTEVGSIMLTWTAPQNLNGVPMSHYIIKMSSRSIQELGGDTTAWFNLAESTTIVRPALAPGVTGQYEITGLLGDDLGRIFYFGLESVDISGAVSLIDSRAATVIDQAKSRPRPVPPIINLTALAVPAVSGRIDLAWTVPDTAGLIPPFYYVVHASTVANMENEVEFEAAQDLSVFSRSEPPTPGAPSAQQVMSVTGLEPMSTFYFALQIVDSNPISPVGSLWVRSVPLQMNQDNWAVAPLIANLPAAVTDLTALTGADDGRVDLAWTAPRNSNFSSITSYELRFATFSVADLGAGAESWYALAASSSRFVSPARTPGSLETLSVSGLEPGTLYYFGLKSTDRVGEVSLVDAQAAASQVRAVSNGIAGVTDLFAQADGLSGAVDLTWTVPLRGGSVQPERYVIKASSSANIADAAAFAAAKPLTAFTGSPLPGVGAARSRQTLNLTGLTPFVTYYFALRVEDSSAPAHIGLWRRDPVLAMNTTNFTVPSFTPGRPDAVTDLTGLTGSAAGEVLLTWTAPLNPNHVPLSHYVMRAATFPVAGLAGGATAWFDAAAALSRTVSPAKAPGALETLAWSGLEKGTLYYFGVRSYDVLGEESLIDAHADPVVLDDQARARTYGVAAVTDLVAATDGFAGRIDLAWTTPFRAGTDPVERYVIRMSSQSNISDDAAFAAARPLTAFSGTPAPSVGAGGSRQLLTVTGLTPFVTYYFALRVEDSSAPVANQGVWLRDPALLRNRDNYAAASFFANLPDPITDLTALADTGVEGDIRLAWTAPLNTNLIPVVRYEVRYATRSVASLANDATSWFNLASGVSLLQPAQAPGHLETLTVGGLVPSATYYFAVRSADALGETSFVDLGADPAHPAAQAFAKPYNAAPGTPSGLSAVGGLVRADLQWSDLPATPFGKGMDFAHYRVERSLDNAAFISVTTTTALSLRNAPLAAFTTYYFRLVARDAEGNESAPSAAVSVVPYTIAPQEPFGLNFSRSSTTVSFHWSPTRRFADRSEFVNPAEPTVDELQGYRIYRSTNICASFQPQGAVGLDVSSWTEADNGLAYFYQVASYNQWYRSTSPVVMSPFGDQYFLLDDCVSRVELNEAQSVLMSSATNGLGANILLERHNRIEDNGGKVMQSVQFTPLLDGGEELKNFAFAEPVKVVLRFATDAQGRPVPRTAAMGAAGVRSLGLGVATSADDVKNLGMYWHNGIEYKKLYGAVDPVEKTVTAKTPNLGKFQIRTLLRDAGAATFDLSNISSRFVTPNDDGKNDFIIFLFDNPNGAEVTGEVFDLRGAHVANMAPGPIPDRMSLQWDGKMNGKAATSGVYVYQIKGDGKTFNGTVVVAR